jgi:hypothetical protein
MLTQNRPKHIATHRGKPSLNFGVMHVGAPCGGMNAAVRSGATMPSIEIVVAF